MEGHRPEILSAGILLALAVMLAAGCSAPPPREQAARPWEDGRPADRQLASSVFHTRSAMQAMSQAGMDPDQLAWYDSRNDHLPAVQAGPQRILVRETSRTYSHDSYGTSNGRVRDNSFTHTYTRRVEETAR